MDSHNNSDLSILKDETMGNKASMKKASKHSTNNNNDKIDINSQKDRKSVV